MNLVERLEHSSSLLVALRRRRLISELPAEGVDVDAEIEPSVPLDKKVWDSHLIRRTLEARAVVVQNELLLCLKRGQ